MADFKLNKQDFYLLKKKIIGNFEWCVPVFDENFVVSEQEEGTVLDGPLTQGEDKKYLRKIMGIRVTDKESKEEKRIYWHFTEEEKKQYEEFFLKESPSAPPSSP